MNILGINSSPRKNGNSRYLMDLFLEELQKKGHRAQELDAVGMKIKPCIGCGHCETEGACIFKDDFTTDVLPALSRADGVVVASPVYFYGFPAKLKALIDRTQVMWSRRYRLKLDEFKNRQRKGILIGVGATKGKDLFDGMKLTARYFFDAATIEYTADLFVRGVDEAGKIKEIAGFQKKIEELAMQV